MTGLDLLLVQVRMQLGLYEKLLTSAPSPYLDGQIEALNFVIQLAASCREWERGKPPQGGTK